MLNQHFNYRKKSLKYILNAKVQIKNVFVYTKK